MSTLDANRALSADDRYELASIASMQERRSRPMHLVVVGAIALTISLIALGLSWRASASAERSLRFETNKSRDITRIAAQIDALRAAAQQQVGDDPYRPIPDLLTRVARIGTESGLSAPLALPENKPARVEGAARRLIYPYTVRDPQLGPVLEWIDRVTREIPAMRVSELSVKPSPRSWLVEVTYLRYERIE